MIGFAPNLRRALDQAAQWGVPRTVGGLAFWWNALSLYDRSNTADPAKNLTKSASNPTYTAVDAAYNGQATYTFGSSQYLVSGTWAAPLTQPITAYAVGNIPGAGTYFLFDGIDSTNRVGLAALTGNLSVYAGSFLGSGVSNTSKHVLCATLNGASSSIYVDAYTTAAATGNAGTKQMNGIAIGNSYNFTTSFAGGKLAEVVLFTGAHTLAQRELMAKYLGQKYGIAVS